jgi:small subunit ribosomal protein S21
MPRVEVGRNEPLERALRRFKKKIEREGVLRQLKARKHYEKPSERRRKKRKGTRSTKRW